MPDKNPYREWHMRDSQRERNQIGKKSQAGVRSKEFTPHGKQLWVQNSLYAWKIYFRVFRVRMIPMYQQSGGAER
jgi:hypothetical protein